MTDFLHPTVSSSIIDNNALFVTAQGLTKTVSVFTSDRGIDNEIVEFTSDTEYTNINGDVNFRKHGQSGLNNIQWLQSGGSVYGLRVTPDDAAYSNIVLDVAVKASADSIDLVTGTRSVAAVNDLSSLTLDMETASGEVHPDSVWEGKVFSLLAAYPVGRGKSYDNLAVRLTINDGYDDTYDFRVYDLEFIERLATGSEIVLDSFLVSLSETALDTSNESLFIEDVVEKYSRTLRVVFNSDAYDALEDEINSAGAEVNIDLVDLVSGTPRVLSSGEVDPLADFATVNFNDESVLTDTNLASFEDINYLSEGSDGYIGMSISEARAARESLIANGYSGSIDSSIADKYKTEIDVILDANESLVVKQAQVALAKDIRKDCICINDVGFQANAEQTLAFRETFPVDSFYCAIFAQDYRITDTNTARKIKVTSTHQLASRIPSNDIENGIQSIFVGPRRGVVDFDTSTINFIPSAPEKEKLYKARINYIDKDKKRTKFGAQLTTQSKVSPLSNINNVRSILRIQRNVEDFASDYQYESPRSNQTFQANLNAELQDWVNNGACQYITATLYSSEYDRKAKRQRVRIDIRFEDIIESFLIDLVVNS